MRRVLVIGSSGAGKSVLSTRLGKKTGLPVIHLDREFWRPGWKIPENHKWKAKVRRLIARSRWIMDGNFRGTQEMRMRRADTIILLDFPRWLCVFNIFRRWAQYYGRRRPDLAAGCSEKIDWEFVKWVWGFNKKVRPKILRRIVKLGRGRKVCVLRNKREIESFLSAVPGGAE